MSRPALSLACATVLLALTAPLAHAAPVPADDGARIVALTQVRDRTYDLTVASPALHSDAVPVRLVVPPGWTSWRTDYPVLYLFHGYGGEPEVAKWSDKTDLVGFTAEHPVIVATPYAPGGVYSDWASPLTTGGPIDTERFHVEELPQLLERNLHASGRRAAAGLSTGGTGALDYAVRHPGRYGAAASFSGMYDTRANVFTFALIGLQYGGSPFGIWGDPVTSPATWRTHNPTDLAPQLTGLPLYLSSGNGTPSPRDAPENVTPLTTNTEMQTDRDLTRFAAQLAALGVPATVDHYGAGTHSYPDWAFALRRAWPVLARGLGLAG